MPVDGIMKRQKRNVIEIDVEELDVITKRRGAKKYCRRFEAADCACPSRRWFPMPFVKQD
jgi:hypothetical protein